MNEIRENIKFSPAESKRFKATIYRGYLEKISTKEIIDFIIQNKIDHIFLRVPSQSLAEVNKLNNAPFPFFVADTLLYYSCDLTKMEISTLRNKDLRFEVCTPADSKILENLVEKIFIGYKNHYYNNVYLDKKSMLEGYKEWVINYLQDETSKIVFKVLRNEKEIAFATCSFDEKTKVSEGVLYGVLPEHSGGGVYTDLIRYTKNYFIGKNFKEMKVSTQSHNYAVQKVWSKEKFYLKESFNTIHINSFFNKSLLEIDEFDIKFTDEDITKFIELSGDDNKLHTSDEFAREKGFESKITHGVLLNSVISKHYGKYKPGYGTIFMNYNYYFFKPIYPNRTYKVEISYPFVLNNKYLSLVKVYDFDKNICVISYNNLLKR